MNPTPSAVVGGKGPVQPHVSNLPRRKPRRGPVPAASHVPKVVDRKRSVPSSSENASGKQTSSSSSSNRTNYPSDSPITQPPFPSVHLPSQSSSSTTSSSQNNASSRFEPNDNVVTRETTPSLPHSLALALPKPKGHVQPHAQHLPRRKRCRLSPEELKKKWRLLWDAEMHKEQVIRGSGVWLAFDVAGPAPKAVEEDPRDGKADDGDNYDQEQKRELEEFARETESNHVQTFRRIVKVARSPDAADERDTEDDGQTVRLFIPREHESDDGIPCLSGAQLTDVAHLMQDLHHSEDSEADDAGKTEKVLLIVPQGRSSDAMALAIVTCRALGLLSIPFANASMPASRVPTRAPSPVLSSSVHADFPLHLPPPILSADPLSRERALHSPALTFLARMYDVEELGEAWRGALSSSGVESVNEVLMNM
ncbi:hypothetical protein V5O48_009667 [Marasmius crinis-equi]|uniref:Uncharacterized protein n=1 Tax=Marasmius crinis-equi TaxID=585013 RepID=A0ABR3FAJ6_9AGAR